MEITRQADYYGLDAPQHDPVPPPEKMAGQLAPSTPWSGPLKAEHTETLSDDYDSRML